MTLTTEQLSAVETTKEFRALLKYMRAIAKAEPESVKEKFELEEGLWRYASQKTIKAIVGHIDALEFALAANREAQPVGFRYRHKDTVSWLYNDWRWPDSVEAEQCQIEWLYTAPPAPAVPDGRKLVPVEPTEEMLRAAYRESGVYSAKAYRAMLAAAPEGGNG